MTTTLAHHADRDPWYLAWRNPWRLTAIALTLGAMAAVVSTYFVFSQTYDEPAHLAAGMEWLSRGKYQYELQHPPLARVMSAVGPYLHGARTIGKESIYYEGNLLLGRGAEYRTRLALSRLGMLPFLLLACIAVWRWARAAIRRSAMSANGEQAANATNTAEVTGAVAVFFLISNPNILAHASVSTLDGGVTATIAMALASYQCWANEPTRRRAAWLGAWIGIATITKFSAMPFIGISVGLAELWRWLVARRQHRTWQLPLAHVGIAFAVGAAIVWAGYRFDVGPLQPGGVPVPAPAFWNGVRDFLAHARIGQPSYLFGETSRYGWWYYYPVALLVKTPLPLLLLSAVGMVDAVRAMRRGETAPALPVFLVLVMLTVGVTAHIDTGVRMMLPMYPALAVLAANGALTLWSQVVRPRVARGLTVALAGAAAFVVIRAHPDHLAYFNPLAGAHPERILSDSNLDWGQDLYRLGDVMQRMRIDSIKVAYFGSADLDAIGLRHASFLEGGQRPTGWIVASQAMLQGVFTGPAFEWLYAYRPVGRIGPSLLLFYIPPASTTTGMR